MADLTYNVIVQFPTPTAAWGVSNVSHYGVKNAAGVWLLVRPIDPVILPPQINADIYVSPDVIVLGVTPSEWLAAGAKWVADWIATQAMTCHLLTGDDPSTDELAATGAYSRAGVALVAANWVVTV